MELGRGLVFDARPRVEGVCVLVEANVEEQCVGKRILRDFAVAAHRRKVVEQRVRQQVAAGSDGRKVINIRHRGCHGAACESRCRQGRG